jgi:hypothetical protein
MRYGAPLLAATLVGPALAHGLIALIVSLGALGIVSGLLDVANNANAVVVERGYNRPVMSSIHGAWSVGLLGSSLVSAGAVAIGTSPRVHFGVVAATIAVLSSCGACSNPARSRGSDPRTRPDRTPSRRSPCSSSA